MTRFYGVGAIAVLLQLACAGSARAEFAVASGSTVRLGYYYAMDPNCVSTGEPQISLTASPQAGRIEVRRGRDYPNFATFNIRVRCDSRKRPVVQVFYRSAQGFRGMDSVSFDVLYPRGQVRHVQQIISVR